MAKGLKCIFVIILLLSFANSRTLYAEENVITVHTGQSIGQVNEKVFGNNLMGYDPSTYEVRNEDYYGYSDYGAGVWDPKWKKPVDEVVQLAKEANISILRFPGGCGTHHYDWEKAIGDSRKHFLYGMDEFLKTCKKIETEPVITVSYFTGNEQDAANLVKYLKGEVKYFEIGNEVYHGNHRDIKKIDPEEYAKKYLKYYKAMKEVDPSIKIGAVLYKKEWNQKVMKIIGDSVNFGILHAYPASVRDNRVEKMMPNFIYKVTLGMPIFNYEIRFQDTLELMKAESGKDIPLAITEYNGGFRQAKPVPYRHCLGTALLNAELLRIFMKPDNNILMANYWQFCNSYWGMIKSQSDFMKHDYQTPIVYTKRPNFYVYELYNNYFGDILLETHVACDTYDVSTSASFTQQIIARIKDGTVVKKDLLNKKWKIKKFSGVIAKETDEVLMIDFKNPEKFNYYHSIRHAKIQPNLYYKLSGYIKTENLVDKEGVCLEVQDGRGWTKTHSAASTGKITGTHNWQYVETAYLTLLDATVVNVLARRIGDIGPLKGRAFFKNVKLEKYLPSLETDIPYLSVNASKSGNGNTVYLMVINKNMNESITSTIDLKGFIPLKEAQAWVLNGPSVDATNEDNPNNVKIMNKKFEITKNPFTFTFEPHSLTALEIRKQNN